MFSTKPCSFPMINQKKRKWGRVREEGGGGGARNNSLIIIFFFFKGVDKRNITAAMSMIRDDLTVVSHSGTHRKGFREVMDMANTVAVINSLITTR